MARPSHSAGPLRRFEGLVITTGAEADPKLVKAALRRAGISGWKLSRLARNAPIMLALPPRGARVGPQQAWQLTYRLREDRDIERAEPAFETVGYDALPAVGATKATRGFLSKEKHLPASDPREWSIRMCNVRNAWAASATPPGRGILIAHPDTGYADHEQFDAPALRPELGFDFHDNVRDPKDPLTGSSPGHGTSTGSVIVSADDPELVGVAPKASLVPLRVNDSVIHFSWRRLCAALYWAVQKEFHVASMSLGGPWGGSGILEDAVRFATQNGLVLISAAGNHWPNVVYPACFPDVIAVAACNAEKMPWGGSSSGPEVDITAPGESVWRALASNRGPGTVERSSGTSYATAHVAGICALWMAHRGGWRSLCNQYGTAGVSGVFKEAIQGSAHTPRGWDSENFGPGIADARGTLVSRQPARAPARGARTATAYKAPGAWERIESFFPQATADQVRGAVLSAFSPGERRVSRRLDPLLDEMNFLIATDPALRAAIESRLSGGRAVRGAGARRPFRFSGASSQLRRRLAH